MKSILLSCIHWIPLTPRGAVLIPMAWLALRYVAFPKHDIVLLAACIGGLFLIFMLALAVLSAGMWLRFIHLQIPGNIDAMETVQCATGLILPTLARIPCIVVDIRWLNCEGVNVTLERDRGGLHEMIRPNQRVQRSEVVRKFEVGDVFGLCRVGFNKTFPQNVRIEPFPATSCRFVQVRRDQQGDELVHPSGKPHGDLIEMRHYRPGDPLKLVLWKHYARTRQLLVRQPEKSIACLSQTVACFVSGPGDEASAGIARTLVAELTQAGEEILFQADGSATATDCLSEAIKQIIQSADVRDEGGRIISGIASEVKDNVIKHCIAFLPSQPGVWIDNVLAGKAASQLQIDAIIGVDQLTAPWRSRFLPDWAFRRGASGAIELEGVRTVVDRLSAAGITTRIIHRRSGRALSTVALESVLQ